MERLRVGDTFYAKLNIDDPYTVESVLLDGYIVTQKSDPEEEQYDIKTIHDLFGPSRGWVLNRRKCDVFAQADADLFTI